METAGLFYVVFVLYIFGFLASLIMNGGDYPRSFVWPIVFIKWLIKSIWLSIKYIFKTIIE
jgi:hypothetical protein